jgi:RNA polymerase sigma factor (sigma-70 family)
MTDARTLGLLDSHGKPLAAHIERVLARLVPRLRRQFPALRDEFVVIEILEEAGRRIASREERSGPIEKLHGYAWVTIRAVATSEMRRPSVRLGQRTLGPEISATLIASTPAEHGTAEEIERGILWREIFAALSPEERMLFALRHLGFSSPEIARLQGRSVVAVDTTFSRARQKVRDMLRIGGARPDREQG